MSRVAIYWDNSNVFIGGRRLADNRDGLLTSTDFRLHFGGLYQLAAAGRPVDRAVCVGTRMDRVAHHLPSSVQLVNLEPGALTGREQGVDDVLQTAMLRDLADLSPGVAVLLTGDGAGWSTGVGFHADLERMHRAGWGVEVLSWNHSINLRMRDWVERCGVFVPLDDYYESVTFVERTRLAAPLNLKRRLVARLTPVNDAA